jgi:hypothetical protein
MRLQPLRREVFPVIDEFVADCRRRYPHLAAIVDA